MDPCKPISAILLCFVLAGCAVGPDRSGAAQPAALADDARKASDSLVRQLGSELKQAIGTHGPEGAIGVCKEKATQIAAAISRQSGFDIKRVSPKNRNPDAVPDDWEMQAQAELEKRLAAGEAPETLDIWQVVATLDGRQFRYARALPVQPLCLACHGENISGSIKARIAVVYPDDKAVGYRLGMLRGIVSVKRLF